MRDPRRLPLRLERRDDGVEVAFGLVDAGDLREAFLSQSVARQAIQDIEVVWAPCGAPLERPPGPPPSLIFHGGRCGSSLVCQALKGQAVVFGEPVVFGNLLMPPLGPWRQDDLISVARWLLGFFAADDGRPAVIKFSSWQVLFSAVLAPDEARSAFIFRDPFAIAASMIEQPPKWASAWLGPEDPLEARRLRRGAPPEDAAALTVAGFLTAGAALLGPGHRQIAYEGLRVRGLPALRSHFGLDPDGSFGEADARVWGLDAKDPERTRPFEPRPLADFIDRGRLAQAVAARAAGAYAELCTQAALSARSDR